MGKNHWKDILPAMEVGDIYIIPVKDFEISNIQRNKIKVCVKEHCERN